MNAKLRITFVAVVLLLAGSIQAQVISFEASARAGVRVKENAGTVVIGVVRDGPADSQSKVLWNFEKEDPGIFAPVAGQIVFASGERRHEITVIILDYPYADYSPGGGTILLNNVQGATLLPDGQRIRVDVLDNEFPRLDPKTPPIECYPPQPSARSDENSAQFALRRLGDSDQPLTVSLTTADQTAKAGVHYVAQSLSLTFAPLETEKTITIPLLRGPIAGRDVTLDFILSGVEDGKRWTNRSALKLVDTTRPGTVDTSFHAGEIERTSFNENSLIQGIVLLPDGRLYISGLIAYIQDVARAGLARLLPNGQLDSTFQENSRRFRLGDQVLGDLFLQPDGHFISSYGQRFFPDGTRDTSWIGEQYVHAVLPDGKLLAQSFTFPSGMIYRLNSDGSPDESFKAGVTNFDSGVFVEPDGTIMVEEWPDKGVHRLVRLLPDGALDTSFRTPADISIRVFARQPDGRYLCVSGDKWLLRLNRDGSLDPSFTIPADLFLKNDPDAGFLQDGIEDLAVQPDGKILVAGLFGNPLSRSYGGLLRLNSDGSLDTSFDVGTGPRMTIGGFFPVGPGYIDRILLQPDGQILASGQFNVFDGFPRMNLVRLNGYTPLRVHAETLAGHVRLTVTGRSRPGYLEYSEDFISWKRLEKGGFCPEPALFEFFDPSQNQPASLARFYRAVFDTTANLCP